MKSKRHNDSDLELAQRLKQVIEERKSLEKEEKRLKSYFKTKFQGLGICTATIGTVLISLVNKERSGLDRKALEAQFGLETIKGFLTQTSYTQVDVKDAALSTSEEAA